MLAMLILYTMSTNEEIQLESAQPGDVTRDAKHAWVHIRNTEDASELGWVRVRCKRHDCLSCEGSRIFRLQKRLAAWATEGPPGLQYHMFTFSEANLPILASAVNSLEWCWRRFTNYVRKVPNHPWKHVQRWARWTEVTNGKLGFNAHFHVVVGLTSRLDWTAMHRYWDLSTGSTSMFNATAAMPPEAAAKYVAAYAKKSGGVFWGGLKQRDMTRYGRALKGRKRVSWSRGSAPTVGPREAFYCCGIYDLPGHCGGEGTDPPQLDE